jgi:carboxyl-terminal processing protease
MSYNAVMKNARAISLPSALGISVLVLIVGIIIGFEMSAFRGGESIARANQPDVDMTPVWKVWEIIDEKFVPAAVASTTKVATTTDEINQERVWGMISGLAGSLGDPYTFFLPPVEAQQFAADMSGLFEGVGMEIAVKDQVLTVVTPLKGTPAERAGMKSGDKIIEIDGVTTEGLSVEIAIKKIRGPKGTQVAFTVVREGWTEPKEIKVTRDVINVPIVNSEMRTDGVFSISVATFTSNAPDLFRDALREFKISGSKKLLIDMRGNPGGYLEAAVQMASWFMPAGKVIVTEDYAGHSTNIVHRSLGYNIFGDDVQIVILVDKGSASASEIFADAMRYHVGAQLVGTNTFGKGSVQELIEISKGASLKITVARWLGPDDIQIPLEGIKPDHEVKVTEEDIQEARDPQKEKALELLGVPAKKPDTKSE